MQELLTIQQTAELLSITYKTARKYIQNNELKAVKYGGTYLINKNDAIKFKASHEKLFKHSEYSKGINKKHFKTEIRNK